ncbi:hypothetical protein J6590_095993, partial [Homalodisca vitripennis]
NAMIHMLPLFSSVKALICVQAQTKLKPTVSQNELKIKRFIAITWFLRHPWSCGHPFQY